jgi:hypothetical protein
MKIVQWLAAAVLSVSGACAMAAVPLGIYSTVSESEYDLYVVLMKGGKAQVRHETWDPGDYKHRKTTTIKAKWSSSGDRVTLKYRKVVEHFDYTPLLSLEELQLKGAAPGLRQQEPIDKASRIAGHSLWLEPHKFGAAQ